jgi:putative transposase
MDATLTDRAAQLATEIATQAKTLGDRNGLIKLIMKSALERMLDTEMDGHLGRKRLPGLTANSPTQVTANSAAEAPAKKSSRNRRDGHSQKTVQGDLGQIKLTTPRDRDGTFEPIGPEAPTPP